MTKTVKQIVDEYLNRTEKNTIWSIMFVIPDPREGCWKDGYCMVTNVYRDGVKLETPVLDNEYHTYEFDSGFSPTFLSENIEWTHRCKDEARIIEFAYNIKE